MFRIMWFLYLFFTVAYIQGCCGQEVILSSDTLDQWENNDSTITCFSKVNSPTGTFKWNFTNTKTPETLESYVTNDCQILSQWLENKESYVVTCTNRSVNSVTIKNITQTRQGEMWTCWTGASTSPIASNTVQILVKVPVKYVPIIPYQSTQKTTENTTLTMTCTSSRCRPEPKFRWYIKQNNVVDGNEQIVSESNPSQGLTNAFLRYSNTFSVKLNRTWNGMRLYCGAQNNNGYYVMSKKILLNITYPPDGHPRIGNFINGSMLRVIKDSYVELNCSVSGGNPLPRLSWNMNNNSSQTASGSLVTKVIRWQATDSKTDALICLSAHPQRTDTTVVTVNVLYAANITALFLEYGDGTVVLGNSNISVEEGRNVKLVCNATGNPPPSYSWSCRSTAKNNTLDIGVITKEHNGSCSCLVENTMDPSFENSRTTRDNSTLNITVLYSPYLRRLDNVTVLEGSNVTKTCNPFPGNTDILGTKWTHQGETLSNSNTLSFSNISRKNDATYTCVVHYTMNPTGLVQKNLSISETMRITVAFSPENVVFSLRKISGEYIDIVTTISVIENDQLVLNCSAESNPPVSTFEWAGLTSSTNSSFHIKNIRRNQTGDVTCNVYNNMKLTEPVQTVIGHINSTLHIDVLYPPRVGTLQEKTIAEGEDLVYPCNFTPGNPNSTTFVWRWENETWDTTQQQQLVLSHVSRNQTGIYTCSVFNEMMATDGHKVHGNDSGHFKLIVEYKATVQRFVIEYEWQDVTDNVTVNENETVKLMCKIDGRPLAAGELNFREADYLERNTMGLQFQTTSISDSETLQVVRVFKAQCTDSGIHSCTGTNKLYTGLVTVANLNLSLNVNCKPRKSPFHQFPSGHIVGSATFAPVTLNFTTLAYPIPPVSGYVWSRQTNETMSNWTTIRSSDTLLVISTSGLQSNLTIKNVTRFDFGLYRVQVGNEMGSFEYVFKLTAADLPIETLTKQKSVGPAVGGAIGGFLAVVITLVSVLVVRKRSIGKRTKDPDRANDLKDSHTYQNFQNEGHTSTDVASFAVYEKLHHTGSETNQQYQELAVFSDRNKTSDGHSPSEGSSFAVYERRQHADSKSDQQYQQLANFSEKDKTDGPNQRVYENLKLSQQNKENNVGSSGSCQNTYAHTQGPD